MNSPALQKVIHADAASILLDSRIEMWCARCESDPETARQWLREGTRVQFFDRRTGKVLHTVCPTEVA